MTRTTIILSIALMCAGSRVVTGQTPVDPATAVNDARKLYDAGQYPQVLATTAPSADPRLIFLRALTHLKLSQVNEARQAYEQLAGHPESEADAWRDIGRSALAILGQDTAGGIAGANQAVMRNPLLPEAYFQQGMALSAGQDMTGAAAAFQKASDLDPNWAYAHFYAGLAYSKAKRVDLTAQHFQTFLRLAPQAPERGEVQSIMRTLNR